MKSKTGYLFCIQAMHRRCSKILTDYVLFGVFQKCKDIRYKIYKSDRKQFFPFFT